MILASTPGLEAETCGALVVAQLDLFDLVTQDPDNDRLFTITTNGDLTFVGEHSLNLKITSVDYPDEISPAYLTMKILIPCQINELIDDGSSQFSPFHLVQLPTIEFTVYLPLYEPDIACDGKSNADIAYSLTAADMVDGLPAWAVFDETAREVKISVIENYAQLIGQS